MSTFDLKNLNKKKIAVLGLGIENIALVEFLIEQNVDCEICLCDARKDFKVSPDILHHKNVKKILGPDYDRNLSEFDIVSRIAGYPLFTPEIKKAKNAGVEITSPTKLFFEFTPSKNIIGVTGTKGKGTVSGMIFDILSIAGKRAYWGGNIGIPMFGFMNKLKESDWVVLELSSFQLEDMTVSPRIAVIINLESDHLASGDPLNPNYHKSLDSYHAAKLNIVKYQKRNDYAIINKKTKLSPSSTRRGKYYLGKGKKIYFTKSDFPSRLVGEHNKDNIDAAVEAAKIVGIREAVIKKAVKRFKGLEHRIEFVKEIKGIKCYDDSFGTTPEAAITALRSFDEPIILIASGSEKGSSFKEFAKIAMKKVKFTILFKGESTSRIKKEFIKAGYDKKNIVVVDSMSKALTEARRQAQKGDVVLLSPACASFGMFNNYKERGDLFKKEVRNLIT